MTNSATPVTIKKYANRRLYNTGTSAYVTLDDLANMVKRGEDFVVFDAKTGDDITRSVLAQIIFEQEGKSGQNLLPIAFLRQLIRFYGDSMGLLVPSYLEFSLDKLSQERGGFAGVFGNGPLTSAARPVFAQLEEQTRQNIAMFRQALTMFTPFPLGREADPTPSTEPRVDASPTKVAADPDAPTVADRGGVDEMRRQLSEMQRRLDELAAKA